MCKTIVYLGEEGDKEGVNIVVTAYIVKNLQGGLIIGRHDLDTADAKIYLRRLFIELIGKEIALTYSGSGDNDFIPMNYMIIYTPTFIVYHQRMQKWAAFTTMVTKQRMHSLDSANQIKRLNRLNSNLLN